jgi:peptidoglycan hydrolase-like protein with peptidoglycan-binding domain
MGLSHRDFRAVVTEGFRRVFGREPKRPEIQFVHAVAELETSCGDGWLDPAHDRANNYGAIQAGGSWTGPTFGHKDSSPKDDGTSKLYDGKFRVYSSPVAGAEDLVKVVYRNKGREHAVLPYAQKGDAKGVSRGLYTTVYYEGFGRTADERIGHHHLALTGALERIARDLREPLPDGRDAPELPARVLRIRSQGPDVAWMQRALGIEPADGIFGPATRAVVIAWQKRMKLKPDGFFGPVGRKVLSDSLTGEELDALTERISDTEPAPPPTERIS